MRIIVPFNLKPGTDVAEYEEWAKTKDVPTASALPSGNSFTVHKATGLFGDPDTPPPYQYFEVLDIAETARPGVSALRLRLVASKGGLAGALRDDEGKYLPDILLDFDYWALLPS